MAGVQGTAESQSGRLGPSGLGAQKVGPVSLDLTGEVRTEHPPPLEHSFFVPGDESDTFIVFDCQMGKLRLRGKVTMIMQPEANLNPVCLTPESVISPLLSSLSDTLSPWLHFSDEQAEAQRGQVAWPRSHSKLLR